VIRKAISKKQNRYKTPKPMKPVAKIRRFNLESNLRPMKKLITSMALIKAIVKAMGPAAQPKCHCAVVTVRTVSASKARATFLSVLKGTIT